MRDDGIDLALVPAEEETINSDQLQEEMRRLLIEVTPGGALLGAFIGHVALEPAAVVCGGGYAGFVSPILQVAGAALTGTTGKTLAAALIAWLHGRQGRKIRVKVGDIEVEAGSAKEVEALLAQAHKIKEAEEPKRIHER